MTKSEFITFLKEKALRAENTLIAHWRPSFEGIDEHWTLYRPALDWMEDLMDLSTEGIVRITFNESFYDDPKMIEMTYEEFVTNYSKSVASF